VITTAELAGAAPKPMGGTPSVRHQLEDDEPAAPMIPRSKRVDTAARKLKVLVSLEAGPRTAKQLAKEFGDDLGAVHSACVMLSNGGLIERAPKNTGYQLTESGVKAGRAIPQEKPVTKPKKRATKPAERAQPRSTAIDPSFAVTDTGALTIVTLDQRVELTVSATKRLAVFIDRTKPLRT
jgi:hypothetical protein